MTAPLRPLPLPSACPGRLYLASMPGRYEPLADAFEAVRRDGCTTIVCLAEMDEIARKSPDYRTALELGAAPCPVLALAIPDYGVPEEVDAFAQHVEATAARLRAGSVELIHCAAGIGRTGLYATAVLLALREPLAPATDAVHRAGSGAETAAQRDFLAAFALRYV